MVLATCQPHPQCQSHAEPVAAAIAQMQPCTIMVPPQVIIPDCKFDCAQPKQDVPQQSAVNTIR